MATTNKGASSSPAPAKSIPAQVVTTSKGDTVYRYQVAGGTYESKTPVNFPTIAAKPTSSVKVTPTVSIVTPTATGVDVATLTSSSARGLENFQALKAQQAQQQAQKAQQQGQFGQVLNASVNPNYQPGRGYNFSTTTYQGTQTVDTPQGTITIPSTQSRTTYQEAPLRTTPVVMTTGSGIGIPVVQNAQNIRVPPQQQSSRVPFSTAGFLTLTNKYFKIPNDFSSANIGSSYARFVNAKGTPFQAGFEPPYKNGVPVTAGLNKAANFDLGAWWDKQFLSAEQKQKAGLTSYVRTGFGKAGRELIVFPIQSVEKGLFTTKATPEEQVIGAGTVLGLGGAGKEVALGVNRVAAPVFTYVAGTKIYQGIMNPGKENVAYTGAYAALGLASGKEVLRGVRELQIPERALNYFTRKREIDVVSVVDKDVLSGKTRFPELENTQRAAKVKEIIAEFKKTRSLKDVSPYTKYMIVEFKGVPPEGSVVNTESLAAVPIEVSGYTSGKSVVGSHATSSWLSKEFQIAPKSEVKQFGNVNRVEDVGLYQSTKGRLSANFLRVGSENYDLSFNPFDTSQIGRPNAALLYNEMARPLPKSVVSKADFLLRTEGKDAAYNFVNAWYKSRPFGSKTVYVPYRSYGSNIELQTIAPEGTVYSQTNLAKGLKGLGGYSDYFRYAPEGAWFKRVVPYRSFKNLGTMPFPSKPPTFSEAVVKMLKSKRATESSLDISSFEGRKVKQYSPEGSSFSPTRIARSPIVSLSSSAGTSSESVVSSPSVSSTSRPSYSNLSSNLSTSQISRVTSTSSSSRVTQSRSGGGSYSGGSSFGGTSSGRASETGSSRIASSTTSSRIGKSYSGSYLSSAYYGGTRTPPFYPRNDHGRNNNIYKPKSPRLMNRLKFNTLLAVPMKRSGNNFGFLPDTYANRVKFQNKFRGLK